MYGGTQSEMKRLISDASKLTDVQKRLGVTVDSSSMSFSNIVAAIHVMQESMQVGGTTAREAATTIEGSVNSMRAAWDNWLTGLGDDSADIATLTGNLADSVVTAASNIVPRIGVIVSTLASQLPSMVATLGPTLAESLAGIFQSAVDGVKGVLPEGVGAAIDECESKVRGFLQLWDMGENPIESFALVGQYAINILAEALPSLGDVAAQAVQALIDGLSAGASTLAEFAGNLLPVIVGGITGALPVLADAAAQILSGLGAYLSENGGQLIESGLEMVEQLSESLRENVGAIADAAIQLALGLAQGLADGIPSIIEHVPEIVSNIAGCINDNAPMILEAAVQIIVTLGEGLISALPTLVENIPQIIQAVVDAWSAFSWADLGGKAVTALSDGAKALVGLMSSAGQSLVDGIVGVITGLPSTLMSLGSQAVSFFSSGISGMIGSVASAASGLLTSIVSALASAPSRLFSIGTNIITGLVNGIKGAAGSVLGAITGVVNNAIDSAKRLLGIHSPSRVFASIGRFTMAGMERGIAGGERGVVAAMRGAMSAVTDAATLTLPAPAVSGARGLGRTMASVAAKAPSAAPAGTVVNQTFSTKVVRADSDLYTAAPTIYRNAMREARAYA